MKATQENTDMIRKGFARMQTKRDFLQLLNYAKPLVYGDKVKPFELRQLSWYGSFKQKPKAYHTFEIAKRSGSKRSIHAPKPGLKAIQKTLGFILQCVHEPHKAAFGFVPNRSILENAQLHVGSKYVFNVDLKDFFPSIDQARVWACLQLPPFNLNKAKSTAFKHYPLKEFKEAIGADPEEGVKLFGSKYGYIKSWGNITINMHKSTATNEALSVVVEPEQNMFDPKSETQYRCFVVNKPFSYGRFDLAGLFANLCCTEMEVERQNSNGEWKKEKRLVLPQGAPTSPIITNMVCRRLDMILTGVAKRFGLKYSRYADDITFSSMYDAYATESEFRKELARVIKDQGFVLNEKKTRLQKTGYRQEVTGLVVNEKVNVNKKYIKDLRQWLYLWETYGIGRATKYHEAAYYKQESKLGDNVPDFARVLEGKLNYLSMIKGKKDSTYLKLRERFIKLMREQSNVEGILELWEKEGLAAAVAKYYATENER